MKNSSTIHSSEMLRARLSPSTPHVRSTRRSLMVLDENKKRGLRVCFFRKKKEGEYFFSTENWGAWTFFRLKKGGQRQIFPKTRPRYPVNFDRSLTGYCTFILRRLVSRRRCGRSLTGDCTFVFRRLVSRRWCGIRWSTWGKRNNLKRKLLCSLCKREVSFSAN